MILKIRSEKHCIVSRVDVQGDRFKIGTGLGCVIYRLPLSRQVLREVRKRLGKRCRNWGQCCHPHLLMVECAFPNVGPVQRRATRSANVRLSASLLSLTS